MWCKRDWNVRKYETLEEVVTLLKEYSWTLCTGFQWQNVLFLNIAGSEDSVQEYAVVLEAEEYAAGKLPVHEWESFSISWMTPERIVEATMQVLNREGEGYADYNPGEPTIISVDYGNHRCWLCA